MTTTDILTEVRGQVGFITLNRPQALNALSLEMVRTLTDCLLAWRDDDAIQAVAIRGCNKAGPFGAFCAGGDIRFFHHAALTGNPELADFFTEEYALNHLIHTYPKPYIAFMDGIVMGGGMGLCAHGRDREASPGHGILIRIVTERTKMAMPETQIGLFPDVGAGYFLSRCPGYTGEWLALTGEVIDASQAQMLGLADARFEVAQLSLAWESLATLDFYGTQALKSWLTMYASAEAPSDLENRAKIDHHFSYVTVSEIVQSLEVASDAWAQDTAATLRKRSPLMLHVALEQIRRARTLSLAQDLRLTRDMVHHCFDPLHLGRSASQSETVEGIRALAIDKDKAPRWNPLRIEAVTAAMVAPFFSSPWTPQTHPLRALG